MSDYGLMVFEKGDLCTINKYTKQPRNSRLTRANSWSFRLRAINDEFSEHGLSVCFMAEYFLPDMDILTDLQCPYETQVLTHTDLQL